MAVEQRRREQQQCTFQPQISRRSKSRDDNKSNISSRERRKAKVNFQGKNNSKTPKKVTQIQIKNFWERNLDFLNEKKKRVEKMDKYFHKKDTFQPTILKKSRKLSNSVNSRLRNKPWEQRSTSRDKNLFQSPILGKRDDINSNHIRQNPDIPLNRLLNGSISARPLSANLSQFQGQIMSTRNSQAPPIQPQPSNRSSHSKHTLNNQDLAPGLLTNTTLNSQKPVSKKASKKQLSSRPKTPTSVPNSNKNL